MTRSERLATVAQACAALWATHEDIDTELVGERVFYRGDWTCSWDTTRRYVRDVLRGMKERGEVDVLTQGTGHWNSGGTLVCYRLTERGRRWLKMVQGDDDLDTGQPF